MAEEPIGLDCDFDTATDPENPHCRINYTPAIFIPNLAMRADF